MTIINLSLLTSIKSVPVLFVAIVSSLKKSCMLIYDLKCNLPIYCFSQSLRLKTKYLNWILSYHGFQLSNLDPVEFIVLKISTNLTKAFFNWSYMSHIVPFEGLQEDIPYSIMFGGFIGGYQEIITWPW